MKALSSTQTIAVAVASTAALATAATAAYHLYRRRRYDRKVTAKQFPDFFKHDQNSLGNILALSGPRTADVNAIWNTNENARYTENCGFCQRSNSAQNLIHTRLNTTTQELNLTSNSFQWAVFWDIENVPIPRTTTASHFVKALRKTLAVYRDQSKPDAILRIHAIANIRRTSIRLRHHLRANGVNLTHVESKDRKDVADKALITEICLTTREYATPFGICLISGDGDFSYAVSRLTALGYDTVVIAPTSKSFSSLLAAVPGAVIPLSTVLEACREPLETEFPLRDKSHVYSTNPQEQNRTQPVKQTVPVHPARRPDRRAVRPKRRERIMLPPTGRDENDCRTSRKSVASFGQDSKADSQVVSHYFSNSYTAKHETVSASQVQPILLQNAQTQVKPAPKRKWVNQSREEEHQTSVRPQNMPTNRAILGKATQAHSGKGVDANQPKNSNCRIQSRNEKGARSTAKLKTKGNITRKLEKGKPDATAQVKQEKRAERKGSPNMRDNENGESKKRYPALDITAASELPVGNEAVWVYIGVRTLPFLILLLVLLFSFVMKSLVPQ